MHGLVIINKLFYFYSYKNKSDTYIQIFSILSNWYINICFPKFPRSPLYFVDKAYPVTKKIITKHAKTKQNFINDMSSQILLDFDEQNSLSFRYRKPIISPKRSLGYLEYINRNPNLNNMQLYWRLS